MGVCLPFCQRSHHEGCPLPTTRCTLRPIPALATGILAVILAAMSIIAGKYAAVPMTIPDADEIVEIFVSNLDDEEFLISYVADGEIATALQMAPAVNVGEPPRTGDACPTQAARANRAGVRPCVRHVT